MTFVSHRHEPSSCTVAALQSDYRQNVVRRLSSQLEGELRDLAEALRGNAQKLERSMAGKEMDSETLALTNSVDRLVRSTVGYLETSHDVMESNSQALQLYDALADTCHDVDKVLNALLQLKTASDP